MWGGQYILPPTQGIIPHQRLENNPAKLRTSPSNVLQQPGLPYSRAIFSGHSYGSDEYKKYNQYCQPQAPGTCQVPQHILSCTLQVPYQVLVRFLFMYFTMYFLFYFYTKIVAVFIQYPLTCQISLTKPLLINERIGQWYQQAWAKLFLEK